MNQSTEAKAAATELLGDIVRRAQESEESGEAPKPTWDDRKTRRVLVVLTALFVLCTGLNVVSLLPQVARYDESDVETLRFELFLVSEEIEAFRAESGRLPESLEILGLEDETLTYEVREDTYSLTTAVDGIQVAFEPGVDDEQQFEERIARLQGGGL